MTAIKPTTKMTPIGWPQRLNNAEVRSGGEAHTPHVEPGEVFEAKDHCSPEWALERGFVKIVKDEKPQTQGDK